jgi:hypothetical protein
MDEGLAMLTMSGWTLRIGSSRGYEDERFEIIETLAGGFRQVLNVSGGGC